MSGPKNNLKKSLSRLFKRLLYGVMILWALGAIARLLKRFLIE